MAPRGRRYAAIDRRTGSAVDSAVVQSPVPLVRDGGVNGTAAAGRVRDLRDVPPWAVQRVRSGDPHQFNIVSAIGDPAVP